MGKRWIWILVLTVLLTGCQRPQAEMPTLPPETQGATESPTEAPTESPTEPPAETQPESPFHSGIREDGTFDAGTLFIGDSLTYGLVKEYLMEQDLLGDARYMAIPGAAPTSFFYGPRLATNSRHYSFFSEEFEGMLMCDGVTAAGESVTAVYFMMGTNYVDGVNVQLYVDILNHILQSCPNATVYLQRVPYATSNSVDATSANKRIDEVYELFREEQRVWLVDAQAAIAYNLTSDGVHLTELGQAAWYEALVAHAQTNGIPQ